MLWSRLAEKHAVVGDTGRSLHGIVREIVGEVRQPTPVQQLVVAEWSVDLHPRHGATRADTGAGR